MCYSIHNFFGGVLGWVACDVCFEGGGARRMRMRVCVLCCAVARVLCASVVCVVRFHEKYVSVMCLCCSYVCTLVWLPLTQAAYCIAPFLSCFCLSTLVHPVVACSSPSAFSCLLLHAPFPFHSKPVTPHLRRVLLLRTTTKRHQQHHHRFSQM